MVRALRGEAKLDAVYTRFVCLHMWTCVHVHMQANTPGVLLGLNVLSIIYLQSDCQIFFFNLWLQVIVTQIILVPMHVTVYAIASYIKGDT